MTARPLPARPFRFTSARRNILKERIHLLSEALDSVQERPRRRALSVLSHSGAPRLKKRSGSERLSAVISSLGPHSVAALPRSIPRSSITASSRPALSPSFALRVTPRGLSTLRLCQEIFSSQKVISGASHRRDARLLLITYLGPEG